MKPITNLRPQAITSVRVNAIHAALAGRRRKFSIIGPLRDAVYIALKHPVLSKFPLLPRTHDLT